MSWKYHNIETNKVNTDVDIKDGETLIIGGLIREDRSRREGGIPVLSKIPILGYLFKGVEDRRDYIETVIYITAYSHYEFTERGSLIDETLDFYELQQNEKELRKLERNKKRSVRRGNN